MSQVDPDIQRQMDGLAGCGAFILFLFFLGFVVAVFGSLLSPR